MLIYANQVDPMSSKVSERLPRCEKPGYSCQKQLCDGLIEKLEYSIFFSFKYDDLFNLWK